MGGITLKNTFLTLTFYFKRIIILSFAKFGQKNQFHLKHTSLKHEIKRHVYLLKTNITNLTQNTITPG